MLRFLIDENISRKLRTVAVDRSYEAFHVKELGLLGRPDWALMPVTTGGDFTFVTNDRTDFLRLYNRLAIHAGLLVIVPSVRMVEQSRLFNLALDVIEAAGNDMVNQLVEVSADGHVTMRAWPFEGSNLPK